MRMDIARRFSLGLILVAAALSGADGAWAQDGQGGITVADARSFVLAHLPGATARRQSLYGTKGYPRLARHGTNCNVIDYVESVSLEKPDDPDNANSLPFFVDVSTSDSCGDEPKEVKTYLRIDIDYSQLADAEPVDVDVDPVDVVGSGRQYSSLPTIRFSCREATNCVFIYWNTPAGVKWKQDHFKWFPMTDASIRDRIVKALRFLAAANPAEKF
jgi:hypothetical protein